MTSIPSPGSQNPGVLTLLRNDIKSAARVAREVTSPEGRGLIATQIRTAAIDSPAHPAQRFMNWMRGSEQSQADRQQDILGTLEKQRAHIDERMTALMEEIRSDLENAGVTLGRISPDNVERAIKHRDFYAHDEREFLNDIEAKASTLTQRLTELRSQAVEQTEGSWGYEWGILAALAKQGDLNKAALRGIDMSETRIEELIDFAQTFTSTSLRHLQTLAHANEQAEKIENLEAKVATLENIQPKLDTLVRWAGERQRVQAKMDAWNQAVGKTTGGGLKKAAKEAAQLSARLEQLKATEDNLIATRVAAQTTASAPRPDAPNFDIF